MKIPDLVLIEWEDAARLDSEAWVDNTPMTEAPPVIFLTVGYLLFQDAGRVVVTGTWSAETIGPRDQIPKGMIKRMVKLPLPRSVSPKSEQPSASPQFPPLNEID